MLVRMVIVHALVSLQTRDRAKRIAVLRDTVAALNAKRAAVHLLVFPAGYLAMPKGAKRSAFARQVARAIGPSRFGVVWGIDGTGGATDMVYRESDGNVTLMPKATKAELAGEWYESASVVRDRGELPNSRFGLLIDDEVCHHAMPNEVRLSGAKVLVVAARRNANIKLLRGPMWHRPFREWPKTARPPLLLSQHTRTPLAHSHAWPARVSKLAPEQPVAGVTLRVATLPGDWKW